MKLIKTLKAYINNVNQVNVYIVDQGEICDLWGEELYTVYIDQVSRGLLHKVKSTEDFLPTEEQCIVDAIGALSFHNAVVTATEEQELRKLIN